MLIIFSCTKGVHNGEIPLYTFSYSNVGNMSQQVGTGFSFTDKGGLVTNEEQVAEGLYSFITQFLTIFSEYQKNDFYVTGEVRRSFVSTCVVANSAQTTPMSYALYSVPR